MDADRIPGKLHPLLLAIYFLMSHSFLFSYFLSFSQSVEQFNQVRINSASEVFLRLCSHSFLRTSKKHPR